MQIRAWLNIRSVAYILNFDRPMNIINSLAVDKMLGAKVSKPNYRISAKRDLFPVRAIEMRRRNVWLIKN